MYNLHHSRTGSSTLRPPAWYGADRGQAGPAVEVRGHMYPGTGVSARGPDCRAQLEMQVRTQVHPQAGKTGRVRQARTQRSHCCTRTRTHSHAHRNRGPARTGMLQPPRFFFFRLSTSLLRPSSRSNPHPGMTGLYLVYHLAAVPAAARSRFRPPTTVSALVHSTVPPPLPPSLSYQAWAPGLSLP